MRLRLRRISSLDRDFKPATPNQAWSAYLTYICTNEGWLYLAVVLDLASREIFGWSTRLRMTLDIAIDVPTMGWSLGRRRQD